MDFCVLSLNSSTTYVNTKFETSVKTARSDNGTKFINSDLQNHFTTLRIIHHTSCHATPAYTESIQIFKIFSPNYQTIFRGIFFWLQLIISSILNLKHLLNYCFTLNLITLLLNDLVVFVMPSNLMRLINFSPNM